MKATLLNIFKPNIYFLENSIVGFVVSSTKNYSVEVGYIKIKDSVGTIVPLNNVFWTKKGAEKRAKVSNVIPISQENYRLAERLKAEGKIKTDYEYQQVLEDGEASEVAQR